MHGQLEFSMASQKLRFFSLSLTDLAARRRRKRRISPSKQTCLLRMMDKRNYR